MTQQRWEELVEAFVAGPVTLGTMFGSKGLRTGTKFFAIWWHERLVLKLPAGRLQELVASDRGEPFEPMEGRRMNGWIVLDGSVDWPPVVEESRAFVAALNG